MNLYNELFGSVLQPPRTIVDIFAERTGGFMGEEVGHGGAVVFCYGTANVGDRVIVDHNGQIIQRIEKLEEVEIIL